MLNVHVLSEMLIKNVIYSFKKNDSVAFWTDNGNIHPRFTWVMFFLIYLNITQSCLGDFKKGK